MKVYIKKGTSYYAPIVYTLKLIEKNMNMSFSFEQNPSSAEIIWDESHPHSQYICLNFYESLSTKSENLKHENMFSDSILIKNQAGDKVDLISTIFYLVNCIQEVSLSDEELDQFNRYKYTHSLQYKFKNIEENLVEKLISSFCEQHNIKGKKTNSRFFISHDIDTIYGSFLQDGFWALKNKRIDVMLKLIAYEISRKPDWRNMDKIIKLNDEYDVKTTFFWLVNKGKGTQGIMNADYQLTKESDLLRLVSNSKNTNGLHKSCSTMSINEELDKGKIDSTYNRYHFLNFNTHTDWKKISNSKLNFDCSLGFAEHYGFRNSYGKAFQPFDIVKQKPFDFVEAPLHFMDGTFHKYMKIPTDKISGTIIDFYEKNPENCDFSLLWHNTYFTSYKYNSFIDEYKKVLTFIHDSNIECISPKELVKENTLAW